MFLQAMILSNFRGLGTRSLRAIWNIQSRSKRSSRIWTTGHAEVWAARQYGYSWREIAEHMGLSEHQAKLRFRYALRKLAARLGYGK